MEFASPVAPDIDALPIGVLVIDRVLGAMRANAAWQELFGVPAGDDDAAWLLALERGTRQRVTAYLDARSHRGADPLQLCHGEDGDRWAELRVAPMEGLPGSRLVVVAVDVTESRRREAALSFDATHDALTGLQNRASLLDKTEWAIARLGRRPSLVAVLFVDLDHFKDVNDRFGHRVGDQVLTLVARRLTAATRPSDVVGRVGGDEFVVVCDGLASAAEADAVAARVAGAVRVPLSVSGGTEMRLGATVGVAVTDSPDVSAATLIERADRAMYEAKRGSEVDLREVGDRNGLALASQHLANLERDLRLEWTHSLRTGDAEATRRWFVASDLVRRAVVALGEEHTGLIT